MKTTLILAASLIAFSAPAALANGNSGAATTMAAKIQDVEKGIASSLSGNNATVKTRGDSGWGNIGSRATTGTQVSKSGKPK